MQFYISNTEASDFRSCGYAISLLAFTDVTPVDGQVEGFVNCCCSWYKEAVEDTISHRSLYQHGRGEFTCYSDDTGTLSEAGVLDSANSSSFADTQF